MKIVFIVGSLTDSHIIKRIDAFCEKGYEVDLYGYKRDVNFTNGIKGVEPIVIGSIENGRYLNRVFSGFRTISKIIKEYPSDTLYYIWGFDIALVHWFRSTKYIYEISDIRYANFPFPLNKVFRYLDRAIIRKSVCVPLTSEGFVQWIGHKDKLLKKYILLPNKLSPVFNKIERKNSVDKIDEPIRIAYAGLYRYPNTVVKLARIIGERFNSRFEFHFWGKGDDTIVKTIKDLCANYSNVFEHGPFKNPDDLKKVYDTFDMVACNYDISGINERIAEPNKLYESIFFHKPIIVTDGTFLSNKVKELRVGYIVNNEVDDIIRLLEGIKKEELEVISKREAAIEAKELIENYEELWQNIEKYKDKNH